MSAKTVPLSKYLGLRNELALNRFELESAQRLGERLRLIVDRLLLLPEARRTALNLSEEFRTAMAKALGDTDYQFGLFVERYTGPDQNMFGDPW